MRVNIDGEYIASGYKKSEQLRKALKFTVISQYW